LSVWYSFDILFLHVKKQRAEIPFGFSTMIYVHILEAIWHG